MDELITSRYETIAKPKPGVIEFLERMHRKGVKMAIATLTARRHAEKALLDRGMMQYFSFMLTIEDVGVPKYEPDIYLEAARRLRPCPGGVHGVRGRAPTPASPHTGQAFSCAAWRRRPTPHGEAELRSVSDIFGRALVRRA